MKNVEIDEVLEKALLKGDEIKKRKILELLSDVFEEELDLGLNLEEILADLKKVRKNLWKKEYGGLT